MGAPSRARWGVLVVASALLLAAAIGLAQPAQPPPTQGQPAQPAEGLWSITAESFRGQRSTSDVGELLGVHIVHDSLDVTADRGRWDQSTQTATLIGNVRLLEGASDVRCDSLVYVRPTQIGTLVGHVDAKDAEFHATADTAHLWRVEERVALRGKVTILEKRGTIEASEVDYERSTGIAVARVGVKATDTESGSTVTGERLVYDSKKDMATVTGDPRLTTKGDDSPMRVRARELALDRRGRIAEARDQVEVWQSTMRARSQNARLDEAAGRVVLTGSPQAWDPSGKVDADTLLVLYEGNVVRRLEARGNVFVTQEPTEGERAGERTRATGDRADAFLSNGVIDSVLVEGNAASDYVPSPRDLAQGTGANYCHGERIRLYMRDGEVERLRLEGGATGRYWFEKEGSALPAAKDTTAHVPAPPDTTKPAEPPAERRVLTLSGALPAVVADTTAAAPDSAAADSLAWAARVEKLDAVAPPDSLFPRGIDEVSYGGEEVEFLTSTHHIQLEKNASVQYHAAWLRAGRIVFDVDAQTIEATSGPTLSDGGTEVGGVAMDYDVETQKGVIHGGRTEFEGGFYQGKRIKRFDANTLLVQDGLYSTCNRPDPHFHFLAPQLEIRLRDKVIGRPVILHIAHIPVLALPYFLFPIEKGRRSGLLTPEVEVGLSDARGRFFRNLGYYFALSDYVDLMTWIDFFERSPRWIGYTQSRYKKRYRYEGQVYLSYATSNPERAPSLATQARGHSNQYEIRARHAQDLGPTSSLKLDANFVSSKGFLLDQGIGTDVEQQVDRDLQSTLSYTKSWTGASLNAIATRRQDLEADSGQVSVTSTLPSVSFSLTRRALGRKASGRTQAFLPFLSSVTWGYSSNAEQSLTSIKEGDTERAFALRHDVSVSDNRKVIGTVSLTPRFSYSEFLFEKDREGRHWERAGRWSAGASANGIVYGTFTKKIGPIVAIRHVMSPSVGFSYQPRIRGGDRFDPVGGIAFGSSARSRVLTFSLQNRYEAKVQRGEEVRKIADLATIGLSTGYNFEADEKPLSPLSVSFRMSPHKAFNVDATSRHDFYGEGLTSLTLNGNLSVSGKTAGAVRAGSEFLAGNELPGRRRGLLGKETEATPGQPWSMSLGYTYSRGRDASDFQSTVRGRLSLSLTPKWALTYTMSANVREKDITTQSFSIRRDLHCWQASLDRRFFDDDATYYFRIGVKDIEEIFYEERG